MPLIYTDWPLQPRICIGWDTQGKEVTSHHFCSHPKYSKWWRKQKNNFYSMCTVKAKEKFLRNPKHPKSSGQIRNTPKVYQITNIQLAKVICVDDVFPPCCVCEFLYIYVTKKKKKKAYPSFKGSIFMLKYNISSNMPSPIWTDWNLMSKNTNIMLARKITRTLLVPKLQDCQLFFLIPSTFFLLLKRKINK